jgi:Fe-S cluster biogenesis protein NfuA
VIERGHIEAVLSRIRPLLQADGADVELIDVGEGSVSVRFSGLCVHCGGASLTMHTGLSDLLRLEIPEFGELRLV